MSSMLLQKKIPLMLAAIMLISTLSPIGVMAENGNATTEPEETQEGTFCALSGMNTEELDYEESTAIQGIVQQDVAASAQEYNQQKLLENQTDKTDRQKTAEDYNLYFMGPDGTIFYSEIIGDRINQRRYGWLIGTNIDGRVEYAGLLGKNLPMCGKSPVNKTEENVCISGGDIEKKEQYIEKMKESKTKADIISSLVGFGATETLTPADVMDVDQTRLMSTEFTTSMGSGGSGSVFILPQALTMYIASMKRLDYIDLAVAIADMGSIFTGASKAGTKLDALKKGEDLEDQLDAAESLLRSKEKLSYSDSRKVKKYLENAQEVGEATGNSRFASEAGNLADATQRGSKTDELADAVSSLKKGGDDVDLFNIIDSDTGYAFRTGKSMDTEQAVSLADKLGEGQELVFTGTRSGYSGAADVSEDALTGVSNTRTSYLSMLSMDDAEEVGSFWTRGERTLPAILESGGGSDEVASFSRYAAGGAAIVGVERFALGITEAIISGWGRKLITVARGLHYTNDLFLRKGYFRLSSAGLTLRYEKNETGSMFRDESVLLLFGEKREVKEIKEAGAAGPLGEILFSALGKVTKQIQPLAQKAGNLGNVMMFGGVMYDPRQKVIEVEKERPRGTTLIEAQRTPTGNQYTLNIREWDNHVFTAIEDPATMTEGEGLTSSLGLWTSKIDIYAHMYDQEGVKGPFTVLDPFLQKIGSWGVFSQLLISQSALNVFLRPAGSGALSTSLRVMGAPLGTVLTSKASILAGENFLTAKTTSMDDLSQCMEENETCERDPCQEVLSSCMNKESLGSTGLVGTMLADYAIASPVVLGASSTFFMPAAAGIALAEVYLSIEKMKVREECLKDLGTCQEHTFTILGAAQYQSPELIQEQEQSDQVKNLPGLKDLPVEDFLKGTAMQNITGPASEVSQQQLNVHSESEHTSGRITFDDMYYVHLSDAKISWIESEFPINLCPTNPNTNRANGSQCVSTQGETLSVGGNSIVNNSLVPFKWMDTELPGLVIPNTAITIDTGQTSCAVMTTSPNGRRLQFNPSLENRFEQEGFQELGRMFGRLRDIETEEGAIYPSVDYNGDHRLELDEEDGSFSYSDKPVKLLGNGKIVFDDVQEGERKLDFKSAVFTGGTIVKRGDLIYVLPRYFKPDMTGEDWRQETKGEPLSSSTGEELEKKDDQGRTIGISGEDTNIPGGEKLGTLTQMQAEKDRNGDGEIQDNERSGWRFYEEANKTLFDLIVNGEKETYDSDQVEVDEEDGTISVYEKDKPHVDANKLREIQTKVDSLGRTLMTVKDEDGNNMVEEALVTYLKGSGGAIQYDQDNNNYVFVNGQPVEVNNDFKENGFNAVTGEPEAPFLEPSATESTETFEGTEEEDRGPPVVPTLPKEPLPAFLYISTLLGGFFAISQYFSKQEKKNKEAED